MSASLIDTSLWIDFTRARSPVALKRMIAPYILSATAALAEPIVYEVMRYAADSEVKDLQLQFGTMPTLATPTDLWTSAASLGQVCRKKGVNAGSLDLLIATVAIHHGAELVTFDADFKKIGALCPLKVKLLVRPP